VAGRLGNHAEKVQVVHGVPRRDRFRVKGYLWVGRVVAQRGSSQSQLSASAQPLNPWPASCWSARRRTLALAYPHVSFSQPPSGVCIHEAGSRGLGQ
jgi:hypothetical protein